MKVKLISLTQPHDSVMSSEDLIAYCARVSNPSNQNNTATAPKLLNYLIKHRHWSPFEMASMTVEIKTSRAIAAQILRHRSFSFQEFSQRYSVAQELEGVEFRVQAKKNRQSSNEKFYDNLFHKKVKEHFDSSVTLYNTAIEAGVSKESARFLLPLATQTTMYMSGTIRSWVHYIDLRTKEDTQKEHREIAEACKDIFIDNFPNISVALGWTK